MTRVQSCPGLLFPARRRQKKVALSSFSPPTGGRQMLIKSVRGYYQSVEMKKGAPNLFDVMFVRGGPRSARKHCRVKG